MSATHAANGDAAAAVAVGKKRQRRSINLGVKLEVVKRFEAGQKVAAIAQALGLPASSARSICVNAGKILESAQNAAPLTATKIFRSRSAVLENMERLLGVWIEDQSQRGAALSAPAVQEKARSLFEDLRQMSGEGGETFGASRGWFERFKKRSGLGSLNPPCEAAGVDGEAASASASSSAGSAAGYPDVLRGVIEEGGYVPGQVFNVDETELYWKRMPARTSIAAEEKTAPGFKAAKDRLTLLLAANASGDLKLKPLLVYHSETPRAIKGCPKEHLPVVWRSNKRAWVTETVFREWFASHFCPAVEDYCGRRGLPNRALLLLDSAPAHPVNLEELSENVRVAFLPPSTTALLQPMDQGVVAAFKAYYLRRTFARLAGDTAGGRRSARDFWRGYNIRAAVDNIADAWREVRPSDVNAAWRKIWPRCVVARPAGSGLAEEATEEVLRDIVGLARSAGLDNVEESDVAELLDSHGGELSNDDLVELLQQRSGGTLSTARLSEAFVHLEAAMDIFREDDPNRERSFKVNRTLAGAVHCYKELYKQKKKYAARRALARLVKSPPGSNAGGEESQLPPLATPPLAPPPVIKQERSPGPGASPQLAVKCEDVSVAEATAPDLRIVKVERASSEGAEETGEESHRGCLATADQNFIEVELSFSDDEVTERPTGSAGGDAVTGTRPGKARPGRGRRARPTRRGCSQCRKTPLAIAGDTGDDHAGEDDDDDDDDEDSDDGLRRKKRRRRSRRRKKTQAGEKGESPSKGSARDDCSGV
ncbi:tigger transposable element-derived protein 1-like [Lethenteron reissneri]|uniref:tigger transposable element-derived protein 1-like n=1 Tax=Lethenteron reissneri TaxID=7753 RepID=UPI002AB6D8F6|nr:tigger transposable element-derived protein 1-like [Lethenteron reissneri]